MPQRRSNASYSGNATTLQQRNNVAATQVVAATPQRRSNTNCSVATTRATSQQHELQRHNTAMLRVTALL
jgi:hypothetical protein